MWLEIAKVLGAPLIAGLVAAFLSNYLAAHFSFRPFRKEQWWQVKREAYESIVRKLSDVMFDASRELSMLETGWGDCAGKRPETRRGGASLELTRDRVGRRLPSFRENCRSRSRRD